MLVPRNTILDEDIHARKVRLIGVDGQRIGVVSRNEALCKAADADLDLVLLSSNAKPPVARVMGYGEFRFEQQEKAKENRKNRKVMTAREIRLSSTIEGNDFGIKLKHVRKFLTKGAKVRVSIRFGGRAITHKELGKRILGKMADEAGDLSNVVTKLKMEGHSMFLMLAPLSEKDKKEK